MNVDERLDHAFEALRAQLETAPPPIEHVARRRTRRRTATGGFVLLALGVLAAVLLWPHPGDPRRSIVANGGPTSSPTVTTADLGGSDSLLVEGYGGIQTAVPPTWTVLRGNQCPGTDQTIFLGPTTRTNCPAPSPTSTWAWIVPAEQRPASERQACQASSISRTQPIPGPLSMCRLAPQGKPNITFVDGTDTALVTSPSITETGKESDVVRQMIDRLTYVPPAGPPTTGASQQLIVARQAADAYALGDCTALRAVAETPRTISCPGRAAFVGTDGSLPASVEAELGAGPDDRGVVSAKVIYNGTDALRVDLQHVWSLTDRQSVWKVQSVEATTPTAALPARNPGGLDPNACALVTNPAGTVVGCVRMADSANPTPDSIRQGMPVYKSAKSKVIVGRYVSNVGFVPNDLLIRADEIKVCKTADHARPFDDAQPPLTSQCRDLLHQLGFSDSQLSSP